MSHAQKRVYIAVLTAAVCVALFPPWKQSFGQEYSVLDRQLGFGFLFRPPSAVPSAFFHKWYEHPVARVSLDWPTLADEYSLLTLLLMIMAWGDAKTPFPKRIEKRAIWLSIVIVMLLPIPPGISFFTFLGEVLFHPTGFIPRGAVFLMIMVVILSAIGLLFLVLRFGARQLQKA
jgi:hypothetical protein